MDLRRSWDAEADRWVAFARDPDVDRFFWAFGLHVLIDLLPLPGRLTVDVGCGEGRLPRILRDRGHRVIGVDGSPRMLDHAASAGGGPYVAADGARLPLRDAVADLVVAYMSLHDVDDYRGALREAARIIAPGGRLCFAVVHPINSAGEMHRPAGAPYEIRGSYLAESRYRYDLDRDGFALSFHSVHRPLEAYANALETAGFLIESLREPRLFDEVVSGRDTNELFTRVPAFLFVRARKR